MIINLLIGILTGFIVSIPPMGPIAFAMISRGFKNEVREGKMVALGAAFMDFFYCLIAFGGVTLIISFFPSTAADFYAKNNDVIELILTFAGCAIVFIYGLKTIRSRISYSKLEEVKSAKYDVATERASKLTQKTENIAKKLHVPVEDRANSIGLFFMGVLLCLSSITLPASWIAIVSYLKGFNILDSTFIGGIIFSVGAFAGTFGWFYTLLKLITSNKKYINQATVNKLNIAAGIILLILGVFLFVKAAVTVINIY